MVTVKRARIKTIPRYRTALFFTTPLLVAAGVEVSELLVPREVRDHLDALEKDWDDFKKKRAELDKELGRHIQKPDSQNVPKSVNSTSPVIPSIWLPIPIWTTSKKAPEYKATDLEWKEFLKLEQDPDRCNKLKIQIAQTVATGVLDELPPPVERAWGFDGLVSFDISNVDFMFPFSPPNIYERPGLLITANGFKWISQELPDERGRRFYRIFHPTVFAQAFWAGGKAFCKYHYNSVQKWLSKKLIEQPKKSQTKAIAGGFRGFSTAEQALLKKAFTLSSSLALIGPQEASELLNVLLPPPAPKSAMEVAVNVYKTKHTHMQVTKWKECPRGGCILTGLIDIRGTKATIRVSVKAIYIPSQDTFLGSPIIGEAIVMPKISMMTADKLKIEKLNTEDEEVRSRKGSALPVEERLQEKMTAEKAKRVDELLKRLETERAALEKKKAGPEIANTKRQTDDERNTKQGQKEIDMKTPESPKSVEVAKEEDLRELENSKTETQPKTKPKERRITIESIKRNSGQGPPEGK